LSRACFGFARALKYYKFLRGAMSFPYIFRLTKQYRIPAGLKWKDPQNWAIEGTYERYGVPTGAQNGVWVLDLDRKGDKDGLRALSDWCEAQGREMPNTLIRGTKSDGFHVYFAWNPEHAVSNRVGLLPGVDVRGEGGYVACGPEYPVVEDAPVVAAPDWLLAFVRAQKPRTATRSKVAKSLPMPEDIPLDEALVTAAEIVGAGLHDDCPERGRREAACFALAGALVQQDVNRGLPTLGQIAAFVEACAERAGFASSKRVTAQNTVRRHVAGSIVSGWPKLQEEYPHTYAAMGVAFPLSTALGEGQKGFAFPSASQASASQASASEASASEDPDFLRRMSDLEKPGCAPLPVRWDKGDQREIALVAHATCGRRVTYSQGEFWAYREAQGVWETEGVQQLLFRHVGALGDIPIGDKMRPVMMNNAFQVGAIKTLAQEIEEHGVFRKASVGVACTNGFVTLGGIEPFSHQHYARTALPFAYDENAKSEEWDAFLTSLFLGDEDASKKIDLLGEFFGTCLLGRATKMQKSLILLGGGANGKSALLKAVESVFPTNAQTHLSPSQWRGFPLGSLVGSRLNVIPDMGLLSMVDSENVKSILHGDVIRVDRKYKEPIDMCPEAGHVFACNELPETRDLSEGFFRSFIVVEFKNCFEGPNCDKGIADRLIAEAGPAILAWMVEGARRLAAKKDYTELPSHISVAEEWRLSQDPIAQFAKECITRSDSPSYMALDLYKKFALWAKEGGVTKVPSNCVFGKRMKALGHASHRSNKGNKYAVLCTF
jgi:putative DNA primase/helicase